MKNILERSWFFPVVVTVLGLVSALVLTMHFPPVVGLGTLVRLPVFHGGLVWANFILFFVLGVVGLVAFFTKNERLYIWSKALRFSSIGLWILNFGVGMLASNLTWDFSATDQSAFVMMMQEPRILMQVYVSLFGIAILVLPLIFEKWRTLSLFDGIFGFASLVMARVAVMFGESLHPDSPALNSEEAIIRFTFIGIAFALIIMSSGIVMTVRSLLESRAKIALETAANDGENTANEGDSS